MWFNKLLGMLVSHLVLLPNPPGVFLPTNPEKSHPMSNNLRLCTAILSADREAQQQFQEKLPPSLPEQNLEALSDLHAQELQSGGLFAWNDRLIEIVPLWKT